MSQAWVIRKIDTKINKEIEVYQMNMPSWVEDDKGSYRQTTSFNAFFKGKRRKNRIGDILLAPNWLEDYEFERNLMVECGANPKEYIPKETFSSIWEFYKYIGYDYKKKKYIK